MNFIRTLLSRISGLFRGKYLDAELDEELRAHIDLAIHENRKRGMSPKQARTSALRSFGGVTQAKEAYRVQRGLPWMDTLMQDLHFGLRMLWKSPAFTVVAVLTLALGIGGNTAMFSIVNGVLLNPLPFPQADRLVTLSESKANFSNGSISYPNFLDWQKDNRSFSAMATARFYAFSLTGTGEAEQLQAEFVSPDFLPMLGVRPLLGRLITTLDNEPGAAPVVLISEGLWRRKFNAAPNIIGQTITLDGRDFAIIGIVPASFHLRIPSFRDQDVYAPIRKWTNPLLMERGAGLGMHGIGRLKPGVTLNQARADMDQISRGLAAAYPDADKGIGATIIPLKEEMVGNVRLFLLVLLGAVGFVLLIACVNVASLLLARSAARSREFAVRAALGASRGRVIRQLLTESLLLGIVAGVLGLIPANWGTQAALKLLPAALPRAEEIGLDFRVLAFTTIVSLLTAALFGLVPAFSGSQANPHLALKEGSRSSGGSHHRALATFVVAEMAIALVLLIGAGLMIRSLSRLLNVDPGFNPRNVLTFGLSLPPSFEKASPEKIRAAFRAVNERFASIPGITGVSQAWGALPMNGEDDQLFWIDGQPKPTSQNDMSWFIDYIVDPDYLRVMQIPLKRGRFLTAQDDEHSPLVAVVDEVFAQKFFPDQDPIGKRIHLVYNNDKLAQIVGVVGHVKQWGLDSDDRQSLRAEVYLSCMQMPDAFISLSPSGSSVVVRYQGSLTHAYESIRNANREMSAQQVLFGDQTMESVLSDSVAERRFAMILLGVFAALALLLACVGIYGVMAYLVSQRTAEIGIRMALGAQRGDVLAQVLRRGARLALIGAGIGIASSLALTQFMSSLLFEVSPYDPATLIGVSALLIAVALTACLIPARRAASVDPMQALRTE
jgi:putative ABC transport system permease protein